MPQTKPLILILLLCGLVYFGWLGRRDIVTSHEARVAQTARTMAQAGWFWNVPPQTVPAPQLVEIDGQKRLAPGTKDIKVNPWVVPVLNGEIRLNKPPLPYWCTAVVFKMFDVGEWQARIIPALLGVLSTLVIYDLARLLFGPRASPVAAIIWITTHFVVDEFRKSMADPYLAFFTLLAIWSWLRTHIAEPRRLGAGLILLFHAAIALGILAKGPVILVTVLPALLSLHLMRRWRVRFSLWHLAGIVLLLLIALPWVILVVRQIPNAIDLWRYDALESREKARPIWTYLLHSPQLTLPWTPLWIAGIVLPFLHRRQTRFNRVNRRRLAILVWTGAIILIFSLKPVKKDAYLLPLMPAMVLTIADTACLLLAFARRERGKGMSGVLMVAQSVIGVGFAMGVGVVMLRMFPSRSLGITAVAVLLLAATLPLPSLLRCAPRRWFFSQSVGYAVILSIFAGMWNAFDDNRRSPRAMAANVWEYSRANHIPIALARSPEELSFYLPLQTNSPQAEHILLVLDRPSEAQLRDVNYIQRECDDAIVERWQVIESLRGQRYVVVEVFLNRSRA